MGLTLTPRISVRSSRRTSAEFKWRPSIRASLPCLSSRADNRKYSWSGPDPPGVHPSATGAGALGAGDVGTTLPGVVLRQRPQLEPRARGDEGEDKLCELQDGNFEAPGAAARCCAAFP